MKKIITAIIVGIFCSLLYSCEKDITGSPIPSFMAPSFVCTYMIPDTLTIAHYPEDLPYMSIKFEADNIIDYKDFRFSDFAEKYDDTSYNRWTYFDEYRISLTENITDISMYSNADYDTKHPVGTPLDDIVEFKGYTSYYFILNKYEIYDKLPFGEIFGWNGYNTISKMLDEINEDNIIMLDPRYSSMKFLAPPTLSKTHTITVKCTLESGRVLTTEKMVTFP